MVSIRLQRTGRRGQAQFRMVVQDARQAPTSGKVIANLGFYNPHTKEHGLDLEKATFYLSRGAQPSSRVVKILLAEKVDLPDWVKSPDQHSAKVKHPDKLRRNRPAEAVEAEAVSDVKETAEDGVADEAQATGKESATEPETEAEAQPAEEESEKESKADSEAESEAEAEAPADQAAASDEPADEEEAADSEAKEA